MDDPSSWRTVFNEMEGRNSVVSKADLEIIKRIQEQKFPDPEFDPYEPTVEWFTSVTAIHPLRSNPEPKSRFIPSKWEAKRVMKMVRALKNGWITRVDKNAEISKPKYYGIWEGENGERASNHIEAPKLPLPQNNESYNPPEEYLPNQDEKKQLENDILEDKSLFVPQKYSSMLQVPSYSRFIDDRFDRCLDLYLCPRMIKNKVFEN